MSETRKRLRLLSPKTPPKHKKSEEEALPFISYNGKLYYYTTNIDCALTCDKILMKVNKSQDILVIGFDMEWPFSFQTGSGKTALIQLSPSLDECFLFHVTEFRKLPMVLTELLSHNKVRLVGVNIKNDIRKLARDFPGVNSKPMLNNCIDVRGQAQAVVYFHQNWSMQKLINHFFKMEINKDKSVRQSKWNVIPLTKAQKLYAATDAYASLKLYLHLKNLKENMIKLSNVDCRL